jgi:hypothetical protein
MADGRRDPQQAINRAGRMQSDVEEIISSSDTQAQTVYDHRKLDIRLPSTNDRETIKYIPPDLDLPEISLNGSISVDDRFIKSPQNFDVFEHFAYEWMEIPGMNSE